MSWDEEGGPNGFEPDTYWRRIPAAVASPAAMPAAVVVAAEAAAVEAAAAKAAAVEAAATEIAAVEAAAAEIAAAAQPLLQRKGCAAHRKFLSAHRMSNSL